MFLDKSRIPVERLDDPRLKEKEKRLLEEMQDPTHRLHVCVHEAAHGLYLKRAGIKHLIYHGPVAFYDPTTDKFDIGSAAIQGDGGTEAVERDSDLLKEARWHAAGGVATNILSDLPDEEGDGRDREEFTRTCLQYFPNLEQGQITWFWEQAKKDVAKDLSSPDLQEELLRRAREFETWLLSQPSSQQS